MNDAIIIFHDKSRKWISHDRFKTIMDISTSSADGFDMDGNYYKFSTIAKLLLKEEFYRQYPNESPPETPRLDEPALGLLGVVRKYSSRTETLKGLIKGIEEYIFLRHGDVEKEGPAQDLRQNMLKKLKDAQESTPSVSSG